MAMLVDAGAGAEVEMREGHLRGAEGAILPSGQPLAGWQLIGIDGRHRLAIQAAILIGAGGTRLTFRRRPRQARTMLASRDSRELREGFGCHRTAGWPAIR